MEGFTKSESQCELSAIIPTRNESANIIPLLTVLRNALEGIRAELLFIDDSDDETPKEIMRARQLFADEDFIIRLVHRPKGPSRQGGQGSAVAMGMKGAQAEYIAVLSANLQHPPVQLRTLYLRAMISNADMVIATRYRTGGSYGGAINPIRRIIARLINHFVHILFWSDIHHVSDPLSSFFLIHRSLLTDIQTCTCVLELLLHYRAGTIEEVPYHFSARMKIRKQSTIEMVLKIFSIVAPLFISIPTVGRLWKTTIAALVGIFTIFILSAAMNEIMIPGVLNWCISIECTLAATFLLNWTLQWNHFSSVFRRYFIYHLTMLPILAISAVCTFMLCSIDIPLPYAGVLGLIPGMGMAHWLWHDPAPVENIDLYPIERGALPSLPPSQQDTPEL
jgi:glycosyltransferase involved in cell wall biosynthesis